MTVDNSKMALKIANTNRDNTQNHYHNNYDKGDVSHVNDNIFDNLSAVTDDVITKKATETLNGDNGAVFDTIIPKGDIDNEKTICDNDENFKIDNFNNICDELKGNTLKYTFMYKRLGNQENHRKVDNIFDDYESNKYVMSEFSVYEEDAEGINGVQDKLPGVLKLIFK